MQSKFFVFIQSTLKGIGQIMLQENTITGILFLIGIFYGSILSGAAALLSTLTGTVTAILLKYNRKEIEQGLYGFSATLVGVAMATFMQPNFIVWIAIIAGSALAAILQHFFIAKKIPAFTFPFILVTWILVYVFHHIIPEGSSAVSSPGPMSDDGFDIGVHGFGEVIFQGSVMSGFLFLVGVFINRPIAALYGMMGAIISAYIAVRYAEPTLDINMGLFSFNALLCGITFAGDKPIDGIWVLLSVVLSLFIDIGMLKMGWLVFTFPFVASSWVTLLVQKYVPTKLGLSK